MEHSSSRWFRVVNDMLHDLAAGLGPGAVLALWAVRNGARTTVDAVAFASLTQGWTWILLVLLVELVVLVVTGAMRLRYRLLGVAPKAVEAKGRAAMVKHGFFAVLFILATVTAFTVIQS